MGHPLIDEFCRAKSELRFEFFRRCQRVFRDEVQPMLNEREQLLEENAALKAEVERLKAASEKKPAAKKPEPVSA